MHSATRWSNGTSCAVNGCESAVPMCSTPSTRACDNTGAPTAERSGSCKNGLHTRKRDELPLQLVLVYCDHAVIAGQLARRNDVLRGLSGRRVYRSGLWLPRSRAQQVEVVMTVACAS
jgi:hypothetical protein